MDAASAREDPVPVARVSGARRASSLASSAWAQRTASWSISVSVSGGLRIHAWAQPCRCLFAVFVFHRLLLPLSAPPTAALSVGVPSFSGLAFATALTCVNAHSAATGTAA